MGMKNLPDISKNLIHAGMDPQTPAALVHWGTMPTQKSLNSTLADLPDAAVREGFKNPSVIVVGNVVSLRDKLNWNEKRPLFGKSVVVTRSREQASEMVTMLMALGANVIQYPTISIEKMEDYSLLDAALDRIAEFSWIIFTSVNGYGILHGVCVKRAWIAARWLMLKSPPLVRLPGRKWKNWE